MKLKRHAKILELISESNINTQEELQDRLNQEGFSVTQATVSRDIKELRLIKTLASDGTYHYTTHADKNTKNDLSFKFQAFFPRRSQRGLCAESGCGKMLYRYGKCCLCSAGLHPLERSGRNDCW